MKLEDLGYRQNVSEKQRERLVLLCVLPDKKKIPWGWEERGSMEGYWWKQEV